MWYNLNMIIGWIFFALIYGAIDCDVLPEEAGVYVNGEYLGIADQFDGWPRYLYIQAGKYDISFKLEQLLISCWDISVSIFRIQYLILLTPVDIYWLIWSVSLITVKRTIFMCLHHCRIHIQCRHFLPWFLLHPPYKFPIYKSQSF